MRQRLLILTAIALLTACGQKGPLVLPQAEEAVEQSETDRNKKD